MFLIFVGYAFVFFDFNIAKANLLPNFIGFFLIYLGISNILNKSFSFGKAKPLALGLAIYDLISTIFSFVNIPILASAFRLLNIISVLASILLTYLIIKAYTDIEGNESVSLGTKELKHLWIANSIPDIIVLLLPYIHVGFIKYLSPFLIVFSIIVKVIFLFMIYKANRTYTITNIK